MFDKIMRWVLNGSRNVLRDAKVSIETAIISISHYPPSIVEMVLDAFNNSPALRTFCAVYVFEKSRKDAAHQDHLEKADESFKCADHL